MKISNETIKKLTNSEMNDLGCMNIGIMLYRGNLKARTKHYARFIISDSEVHYENYNPSDFRFEFIKLADFGEVNQLAMRIFNKKTGEYEKFVGPLDGMQFLK